MTAASEPLGAGMEEPARPQRRIPPADRANSGRSCARSGRCGRCEPGEVLFRAGDDSYDFFVVESGAVAIVQGYGDENRVIAVHGQHRFLGELNLLTGARA